MDRPLKLKEIYYVLQAFFASGGEGAADFRDRSLWVRLLQSEMQENPQLLAECKLANPAAWPDPLWCFDDDHEIQEEMRDLRLIHQTVTAWIWNKKLIVYGLDETPIPPKSTDPSRLGCIRKWNGGFGHELDDSCLIDLEQLRDLLEEEKLPLPASLFPPDSRSFSTVKKTNELSPQPNDQLIPPLRKRQSVEELSRRWTVFIGREMTEEDIAHYIQDGELVAFVIYDGKEIQFLPDYDSFVVDATIGLLAEINLGYHLLPDDEKKSYQWSKGSEGWHSPLRQLQQKDQSYSCRAIYISRDEIKRFENSLTPKTAVVSQLSKQHEENLLTDEWTEETTHEKCSQELESAAKKKAASFLKENRSTLGIPALIEILQKRFGRRNSEIHDMLWPKEADSRSPGAKKKKVTQERKK